MSKNKPLVSVLTPCFNSARFIERTILSVLNQDYPHVEHIIQDGGSTDGTVDILKKYGDRISWISEKDKGQSDGLNRALQRSKGEVIGVLNADDEYLPEAATWAVTQLEQNPEMGVVYGQQYNIDDQGRILYSSEGPEYSFEKIFCCHYVIPAQAAFVRRSAWEKAGFYIDTTRPTCPDYEMWVRIGLSAQMKYIPGFVACYRLHPGSEGQQEQIVHKMVASKLEVVNRICDAPQTPPHIRKLRRKAKAGVYFWSASHFLPPMTQGKEKTAFKQVLKSIITRPDFYAFFTSQALFVFLLIKKIPFVRKLKQFKRVNDWLDLSEKKRVFIRMVREVGRKLDAWFFAGNFYKHFYSPLKYRIKQNRMMKR